MKSLSTLVLAMGVVLAVMAHGCTGGEKPPALDMPTPEATPSATQAFTPSPVPTSTPTPKPPSRLMGEKLALAAYYPWYDPSTWTQSVTADAPLQPYNSDDPAVIARQVKEARGAGIDGFISAWLAPYERTDSNFAKVLEASAGTDFSSAAAVQTSFYRVGSQQTLEDAIGYIVATHGNHPNYLRVGEKPVIFFTDMPRVPGGEVDPKGAWRGIRSRVDPEGRQIWIAEGLDPSYLAVFDGLYVIKISHRDFPDDYLKLPRWGSQVRQQAQRLGEAKIWVATVMAGWDDTRTAGSPEELRDPSPPHRRDREDGQYYLDTFKKALESGADWLYIHSFNEWVEGSQIEPSVSYGQKYLNLTRELLKRFKG